MIAKNPFILFFLPLVIVSCQCNDFSLFKKDKAPLWKNRMPQTADPKPFPMDSTPLIIKNAKVMTASGKIYPKASVFLEKGLIKKVSEGKTEVPPETLVIDGSGMVVTPGLIDVHSHMGVYSSPHIKAHSDGNEVTRPVTADIWAEHGFWPQDPSLWRALAGGVTTIQVLPGSANLIGGRSFTAKLIPRLSAREMRFPGAPQGLKMACGENPKRVYGEKGGPSTRMGVIAGFRAAFQKAIEYNRKWADRGLLDEKGQWKPKNKKKPEMPDRDFVSETLSEVLKGNILVHIHCYRADDLSAMLDLAKEFDFKIRSFQHGLEAYKIRHRLAKEEVAVASWADWWGFKAEAFDGIPQGLALLADAGARAIVHSDSEIDVQYLNVEAGKAMVAGRKIGLQITEDQALQWVTKNPAWALGIDDKVGTIEEGKMADLVVWDGHPFSIYTKTRFVVINGKIVFDRHKKTGIKSDFEVGQNDSQLFDGREFGKTVTPMDLKYPDPNEREESEFHPTGQSFIVKNVNYLQPSGKWQYGSVKVSRGLVTAVLSEKPENSGEDSSGSSENSGSGDLKVSEKSMDLVDGKGRFLTPGLIDPVTQLGLMEISLESSTYDYFTEVTEATPDNRVMDALNLRSLRIPIARQGGITTVIARPVGHLISGMGVGFDLHEKSQYMDPRVAMFGQIGKFHNFMTDQKLSSRSMQWRDLRKIVDDVLSFSKDPVSYEKGNSRKYFLSKGDMKAMLPVLKGKIPWVIRVNRASDIKTLIRFKEELNKSGLRPKLVIEEAVEAVLVASSLKEHGIPVILQPSWMTNQGFDALNARFDTAAVLSEKGVKVMFSSLLFGGFIGYITRLRQEAGIAVKYGMSVDKALQAITQTPAQVFGIPDGRGKLMTGVTANLVLWSGDPLEPTSWVEKLWINGHDIKLEDRQSLLAEKYKSL